ncbi:MAG: hypothetical protein QOE70_5116 [Chthoniobacter sp.]|jgi:predicted  nucleic acid-binding Zn-ribbon protein|nr:hypothetical protein [Chthoniobacter sp.]
MEQPPATHFEQVPKKPGQATATAETTTGRGISKISSNRDIAVVQADYFALSNDLEQAQALASALEMQLSGKTNELARFKVIWERTQADLSKFEHDIDGLRRERHELANQVQRSFALEHQLEKLKKANEELKQAHEELKARAHTLETELTVERATHTQTRREMADLRDEVMRRHGAPGASRSSKSADPDPELKEALLALQKQLERVLSGGTRKVVPCKGPHSMTAVERDDSDHIEISFGA